MLTKDEILLKLRELLPDLKKEYAVKRIGLFGSYSQNAQHPESDIDLLVEFEKPIGWKALSLELFLQKVFGKKVDLVTKNALKAQIEDDILNQVNFI